MGRFEAGGPPEEEREGAKGKCLRAGRLPFDCRVLSGGSRGDGGKRWKRLILLATGNLLQITTEGSQLRQWRGDHVPECVLRVRHEGTKLLTGALTCP
jgi:hypothetical protein